MNRQKNILLTLMLGILLPTGIIAQTSTPQTSPVGSFSVSPTGGATYTIPIDMPQGLNGLQPQIAVVYNSQTGNGLAGWGCGISGISVISRGPRDIYHDETPHGISYDANDAFFLDGQRLIRQNETTGADSIVFCPESSPYTRVVLHGLSSSLQSSMWFSVKTADGMNYEYGKDAGKQSYVKNGTQKVNAWYISKAENSTGNSIEYEYSSLTNFLYPSRIKYGRVTTTNETIYHMVEFTYEPRQDKQDFYIDGLVGRMSKRLKYVTSYTVFGWGAGLFRKYSLAYSNPDGCSCRYSRLWKITETNKYGTALQPVIFNWEGLKAFCTQASTPVVNLVESNLGTEFDKFNMMTADINGDGISDIIQQAAVRELNSEHYTNFYFYLSNRNSSGDVSFSNYHLCRLDPSVYLDDEWQFSLNSPSAIDFDGDGLQDLLIPIFSNIDGNRNAVFKIILGESVIAHSSGYLSLGCELHHSSQQPLYVSSDFDKDGKDEFVILEKDGISGLFDFHIYKNGFTCTALSLPFSPQKMFAADFNCDGMTDILVTGSGGYKIFWNQGGLLSSSTFTNGSCYSATTLSDANVLYIGDFNGDGCPDFLRNASGSTKWYFFLGNGQGGFSMSEACDINVYDQGETNKDDNTIICQIYDMDGDGKSDVFISKSVFDEHHDLVSTYYRFGHAETCWLLSNGTTLTQKSSATSANEENAWPGYYTVGDLNGDGQYELLHYGYNCWNANYSNAAPNLFMFRNNNYQAASGKIVSVSRCGQMTYMNYGMLTYPALYTRNNDCSYPVLTVTPPLCVVASSREGNGVAGDAISSYAYKNFRCHLQGRGILGFSGMTVTNSTMGLVTETNSTLDGATLLPSQTVQTTTLGGSTATITTTYRTAFYHGTKALYHTPLSSVSIDLDGHTTTTTYSNDSTRNNIPVSVIKQYYDGAETKISYANYVKKGNSYFPGLEIKRQKHPDCTQTYVTTNKRTYDSKGRVISLITLYGTPKALTTSYTYDNYGNVLQTLTSGSDIESVKKNYEYDSSCRFVTKETERDYYVTKYTYNDWGEMLTRVNMTQSACTQTTRYVRDEWGRLVAEIRPGLDSITYTWSGNVSYSVRKKNADGSWFSCSYDAKGRELSKNYVGLNGSVTTCSSTYDNRGNVTKRTTTNDVYTIEENLTYDGRGRLLTYSKDWGDDISYQYGANQVAVTINNQTYTRTYDSWGHIRQCTDPIASVIYQYHSNGNPMSISSEGAVITMSYDQAGNRVQLVDPDAGTMTYVYDALGRIVSQTDGRGVLTQYSYNAQGQVSQTTTGSKTTVYTYGQTAGNKGLLLSAARDNYTASYQYNTHNQLVREQRTFGSHGIRAINYAYNHQGLVESKTFPGNLTITYEYDSYGNLERMFAGNRQLYKLESYDIDESLEKLGTNIYRIKTYDQYGRITDNVAETIDGGDLVFTEQEYQYDYRGNQIWRRNDGVYGEDYEYDELNRLIAVYRDNPTPDQEYSYQDNGNIAFKSDFGTYTYENNRPHAVKSVNAAPNATAFPNNGVTITLEDNGKIAQIADNDNHSFWYSYGPDNERWVGADNALYFHEYEEREVNGMVRRFVYLENGVLFVTDTNDEYQLYYMNTDNLGSILEVCDEDGNQVFLSSYDVWGRQTISNNDIGFYRGYTGHEMLQDFNLINMNGRVYDPASARFLSPDNYVQFPYDSQNFNRYSYCLNNPLKYTDPSGELFGIDDFFVVVAVGAVVGGIFNVASHSENINSFNSFASYFSVGAFAGGVGAGLSMVPFGVGGVIGGALTGLLSGSAFGFILGGGNSYLNNGDFSHFWGDAFHDALVYGISGAVAGGIAGGYSAYKDGKNIWTGELKIDVGQQWGSNTKIEPQSNQLEDISSIQNNTTLPTNYYPHNDGAIGEWNSEYLYKGTRIDRFGDEAGKYVSPYGTPIEMRALPPNNAMQYNSYLIVKPIEVRSSVVAPWFGKIGYGMQYRLPRTINDLLKRGIIIPLK